MKGSGTGDSRDASAMHTIKVSPSCRFHSHLFTGDLTLAADRATKTPEIVACLA